MDCPTFLNISPGLLSSALHIPSSSSPSLKFLLCKLLIPLLRPNPKFLAPPNKQSHKTEDKYTNSRDSDDGILDTHFFDPWREREDEDGGDEVACECYRYKGGADDLLEL